jgi:hypothetical protein
MCTCDELNSEELCAPILCQSCIDDIYADIDTDSLYPSEDELPF